MNSPFITSCAAGLKLSLVAMCLFILGACGGGGGSPGINALTGRAPTNNTPPRSSPPAATDTPAVDTATPMPSASDSDIDSVNANQCAVPVAASDRLGSLTQEKAWVRALMDKTYLWYQDIPPSNAASYTAAAFGSNYLALDAYFESLKTPLLTASGKRVDEFSFTLATAVLDDQQAGITSGYGMRFTAIRRTPPRDYRVLYVENGSPAALAGIARGDQIKSIDGVSIDDNTNAGIDTINNGLYPVVSSKTTRFGLLAPGAAATRFVSATSSENITVTPVAQTKTLPLGTQTIGYLVLNSFSIDSAEQQLLDAITQLKAANIQELVLDLRYNGGGYLDLSNQLSWMIGGSELAGKVYERTVCNDKNPFAICNTDTLFQQKTTGFSAAKDQALPQLGLKRVFVLTSSSTCSASEAVINGLSPFLQVIRIGSTTCGKPYGFYYRSNCGTSYAAMQFKGANAVGFGDYADGFAPTCKAADDLSKQRGDANEAMFSTALGYIQTGSCPAGSAAGKMSGSQAGNLDLTGDFKVFRSPIEEQRLYRTRPR